MKQMFAISMLCFFLFSCATSELWRQTIENTHQLRENNSLTEVEYEHYRDMSLTNKSIQLDPVTKDVYIRRPVTHRFLQFGFATLLTPFTLMIDIPLYFVFGVACNCDCEKDEFGYSNR